MPDSRREVGPRGTLRPEEHVTWPEGDVRTELRLLAERYARGVDRREVETILSAFSPDATLSVHRSSDTDAPDTEMQGHGEISRIATAIGRYTKTFHLLGQSLYEVGDGRATGEVYCVAHHLTADRHGGTDQVMYIRYDDQYGPDADGAWRISTRRVMVDWTETRAVKPATT